MRGTAAVAGFAVALGLVAAPAQAEGEGKFDFYSARDLGQICRGLDHRSGQPLPEKDVKCNGYIAGVLVTAVNLLNDFNALAGKGMAVCIEKVNINQFREKVLAYIDGHPGMADENASKLVLVAVREAFPCKKGD